MSTRSDESHVSEARLCKLADVPRQNRRNWAANELLTDRADGHYGRLDLLELVACASLIGQLGPTDGRAAWTQVRQSYAGHALAARVDVVFSLADHEAVLVVTDEALARAVRHGRPVRVISLGEEMQRGSAAFLRYQEGLPKPSSRRTRSTSRGPRKKNAD